MHKNKLKELEKEHRRLKDHMKWLNADRAYANYLDFKAGKITKKELDRRNG